jgi:hypothetical protein
MMHLRELKDPPVLDVRTGRVDQWIGSLEGTFIGKHCCEEFIS